MNVMKKYPEADFQVYAVWFNMLSSDRKDRVKLSLIPDNRVKHYWDEDKQLGKWISKNLGDCKHLGAIDWDSYYLFDENATWGDTLEDIKACGTPIVKNTKPLEVATSKMFGAKE